MTTVGQEVITQTAETTALTPEKKAVSHSLTDKAKLTVALGAIGFQQSTANEMARTYVGFNVLEYTHNPMLAGLGVGMATFAIEGVSATTMSLALEAYTDKIDRVKRLIKGEHSNPASPNNVSKATDVALALSMGTGAVLLKRHVQYENRTFQDDKSTIAKTAGGIALFSAGVASIAAGGIEYADRFGLAEESEVVVSALTDWRLYALALVAIQGYGIIKKQADNVFRNQRETSTANFDVALSTNSRQIKKALKLEQEVWDLKGYGDLGVYERYLPQSRIFTAFNGKKCIGVSRIFEKGPELAPFLEEMPYYDESQKNEFIETFTDGKIEELGTIAVSKEASQIKVTLELWRLAYRDAIKRGVENWGIIMEPKRVQVMNKRYGFTFKQQGPTVDYQGGDCAAHVMNFDEVRKFMQEHKPEYYKWFALDPID